MRAILLTLPLAACSGGGGYVPQGCEPGSAVRSTVSGVAEAGFSNDGFVTDSDLDIVVAVGPPRTTCR